MLVVFSGILIITYPARGESLYSTMKKGADHYEQGRYDEALKSFVDAQIESPENPRVKYNIAGTQYQMKSYGEAVKSYQDVAATARDVRLEEQSLYNIGNCLYRQGKLEESLEYYKKALDLDPNDQDAKYNLEFVREEIKKRRNQAKQREQQQQKNKQEEKDKQERQQAGNQQQQQQQQAGNQQQQQEQKQEGNTQEEDRQGQEQQTQQQQAEEEKQDQAPQHKEEEQPEQAAPEEQQAASAREEQAQGAQEKEGQARQMTKEEAENWLRSVKEGKRDYNKGQEERGGRSYRPSKDW
jgi:Ca-activated chloride channel family protein